MSARREQVIGAASRLFRREGFSNASMRDVGAAVGLSAPALYRHFPGKQALLRDTIRSGLELVEDALRRSPELDESLLALAQVAVRRDDLWLLIRRESRHLEVPARADVRRRLRRIEKGLAAKVARARPSLGAARVELVARAAVAVLGAPSQYPQRLERGRLATELAGVAIRLCHGEAAVAVTALPLLPLAPSTTRRDELLDGATRLFATRGYAAVTLGEIGAAAGMTGPSLYHHFAGKADILVGVLSRAIAWIDESQRRALAAERPPDVLIADYVTLAISRPELLLVFTAEAVHLPAADRARLARANRRFVDTWVTLVCREQPRTGAGEARVRVAACLSIVNELASSRRMAARPGFAAELAALATATLGD